jgi:hypothetical protein
LENAAPDHASGQVELLSPDPGKLSRKINKKDPAINQISIPTFLEAVRVAAKTCENCQA